MNGDVSAKPFSLFSKKGIPVALLLLILAGQCVYFAFRTGQTVDETFYSGGAYPIVRYNQYNFLGEHPPLLYQLAGLPLLFLQPNFPIDNPVYLSGGDQIDLSLTGALFLYQMGNDPQLLLFLQRLPLIALTVLLGLGIFGFARELYGYWGALLALCLYSFMPDVIGNGSLFMTDMGLAAFYFFSICTLKKFFEQPGLRHAIGVGILCGLTFMTKISGLVLFPIVTFLFLLFLLIDPKAKQPVSLPPSYDKWFGIFATYLLIHIALQKQAMVALGPLCILAVYLCLRDQKWAARFRGSKFLLRGFLAAGFLLAFIFCYKLKHRYGYDEVFWVCLAWYAVAAIFTFFLLKFWDKEVPITRVKLFLTIWLVAAFVIILDFTDFFYKFHRFSGFANYVKPFEIVLSHSLEGHKGCLAGSWVTCDWRYFFEILAIKTPLLILGLSILGLTFLLRHKISTMSKALVIVPLVFFLGGALLNRINIGIRHILPIFPFLFILAGVPGAVLARMKRGFLNVGLVAGLGILLSLFIARTLQVAPHYFTYFNEAVGSAEEGARLIPVNLGQDNKNLAEFVLEKKIPSIKIGTQASNADIYNYYGIPWQWMGDPEFVSPEPGLYALGIDVLMNQRKNPDSWFRDKEPVYRIGKTFYIFEVSEVSPPPKA